MTAHAYAPAALAADYARAGVGLGLTGVPLIVFDTVPLFTVILTFGAVIFAALAVRTLKCQLTRIEATEDGISAHGASGIGIPWHELSGVRLAYYASRRDRSDGWLQMVLAHGRRRLTFDSRIGDFETLAARAAAAATRNGLALDATTADNLHALGIALDPGTETGRTAELGTPA